MRISDWSSDVCSSDLLTRCLSVGAHPVPFCGSAPCAFLWERTLCFSVGAHPVPFCGSAPCAFLWELTLCFSVGAHPVLFCGSSPCAFLWELTLCAILLSTSTRNRAHHTGRLQGAFTAFVSSPLARELLPDQGIAPRYERRTVEWDKR